MSILLCQQHLLQLRLYAERQRHAVHAVEDIHVVAGAQGKQLQCRELILLQPYLFIGDAGQKQPQSVVVGTGTGADQAGHIVAVQELEVRVVHPAGVFRPALRHAHAVHHHQQLLLPGLGADVVKVAGAGQGVFVLGHLHDNIDAADLLLRQAGGQHLHPGQALLDVGVGPAQLAQDGDDRHHVVDVVDAVGDQGVGVVLPALAEGHGAARHVHAGGQIVTVRGVEAAVFADGAADVVVAAVLIAQWTGAAGADAHVVQQVLARRHIGGQAVDAEVDPGVLRRHGAGDQIVGIQNQLGRFGEGAGQDVRDVAGVGVAHDGVAEQIGDHDVVRLHIGVNSGGGALVYLQHRHVALFHAAQQVAVPDEGGGHAGDDVAAGAVVQHAAAAGLQNVVEHVGHRGLAVGAGDGHDGFGLAHVAQKVGAQPDGKAAGEVRAVVVSDLERGDGQLGHPQRKEKSQFTHGHSSLSRWVWSQIISAPTSAGETPEMRLACPRFRGRTASSFSRASRRRPCMAL